MQFEIVARATGSSARAGRFHTPHGIIETPAFMPVGTQATVKGLLPSDLAPIRPQCVLANAYHLAAPARRADASPGAAALHAFMGWDGPMLTDSGGYQVFSLAALRQIDDRGVTIASHLNGRPRRFTPASVVRIEEQIGADIIMPLDVCIGYPSTRDRDRGRAASGPTPGRSRRSGPNGAPTRRSSRSSRAAWSRTSASRPLGRWPASRSRASPSAG